MTQPRMRKQKRSFRLVASAFVGVIATNEITTIFVEAEAEAEAAEAAQELPASASLMATNERGKDLSAMLELVANEKRAEEEDF